ncbi:MAG: VWA domain-containing protein [Candidatus Zixiibacteriota bacterium]|nr:MAG: VWA domain-containing protein [candidate division Zixibacteria bacterium]
MIRFKDPIWLLLLILPVAYLYIRYFTSRLKPPSLPYSNINVFSGIASSWKTRLSSSLPILKAVGLSVLILAMARPQSGFGDTRETVEGVDIMLALDISSSMKAIDFKPKNRLYVAKEVIRRFIDDRESDRLGLVVFARRSFTQCPLTTDYELLKSLLQRVDFGMVEDRTAIGLAIANAANRLRDSNAKTKIIILLTDGVNNVDDLAPIDAARAAAALGIKIYTIGAGKPGMVEIPIDTGFGTRYVRQQSEIDEETLKEIASVSNGKFYRAKDETALKEIYDQISRLEKTKIEVFSFYRYTELFSGFLMAGLSVLFIEFFLHRSLLGGIPE